MTCKCPGSFPTLDLSVSPYDVHEMFRERLPSLKLPVRSYAFPMFGGVIGFALVDMSRNHRDHERLVTSMVDTIGLDRGQVEDLVDDIAASVRELGEKAGMFKPRVRLMAEAV